MTDKIIRGSGGPPPTPPSPTRAPDTLNSRQFASIQDLLSEGEIEGFATPSKAGLTKGTTAYNNAALKDIFLNDTPILNASASNTSPGTADFNFQNVSFAFKEGIANQTHIPGIESSESTTGVGVTVTTSAPVTRQITNTNVDAAKVTITFPQLQKATDQNDLLGSSVDLKIQVQYNSGGFNDIISDTITGRSADAYQKEYRVNITGAFPVDIRVVRVTADSTSDNLKDEFAFTSIAEIIDDKQTYPNSAYTNLRLDSEQFSSIPKRAFRIRGVKVKIPAPNGGLTPTIDPQTGRVIYPANYVFNGVMGSAQWCSCPALILLDLLTTERYGFGTHITDSSLDLYSFVAASRYANEQVNDSRGGLEARFSCNVNIQGTTEAYTLINELAGVMRAFPIWQTGSITLTQDKPTDPSYLFSLANVGEGGFSYSGSSLKQRHTVISVSYFNMDSREIDYEVVEDTAAQAKLGIVKKDVKAFACTSRGQAFRLGKAILFSEQQESEVVSFTTSIDAGAIVRPGSVIRINDPVRSGVRRSGRLKSINTAKTQITVDNAQDLSDFMGSGTDHKCSVMLPNGTLETRDVSSSSGIVGSVIHLDSALSQTPNVNTVWLLHKSTSFHQTFRVITVEEQDGINYAITALTYLSGKYANIEQGTDLPDRNISLLNQPRNPPGNLQASERIVVINALAISKIILSWVPVTGVTQYLVQYRFNNTNWISEIVFRPDFEIINSQKGAYEFRVFSYNAALKISATSTDLTFNAVGKTTPPAPVQNLSIEPVTNKLVRLRWNRSTDADVIHGGRVYVRHSNLTDGSGTFQNSVDLITALSGNSTDAIVPFLEGEYILKYEDDNGNFSTSETSIIVDLPDLIDTQTILTQREDLLSTPFSGTTTNTTFNSTAEALQLTNPANNATGEYEFASIVDLGAVFSLELKRKLQVVGFNIGTDIETLIPGLPGIEWDDYATDNNFDGAAADEASCQIQVAASQTASGSFGAFNNFANGTFKGRRFKFKLILTTTNTAQNINVQQAGFIAQFQSRTEQNYQTGSGTSTAPQSSGTSAKTVTFGTPFFVGTSSLGGANAFLPTVGITIENAQSGDFFTITNVSGTGFTVNIKNGSSFVDRNFTFQAVGYGKGV
jgi:predicted phage tail protein